MVKNGIDVLLLDREQGAKRVTDRREIEAHRMYVLKLLMNTAALYGLEFEEPADYIEPEPPPKGSGYWMELGDPDGRLLTFCTFEVANLNDDVTQPLPEAVAEALTAMSDQYALGLEFCVPVS